MFHHLHVGFLKLYMTMQSHGCTTKLQLNWTPYSLEFGIPGSLVMIDDTLLNIWKCSQAASQPGKRSLQWHRILPEVSLPSAQAKCHVWLCTISPCILVFKNRPDNRHCVSELGSINSSCDASALLVLYRMRQVPPVLPEFLERIYLSASSSLPPPMIMGHRKRHAKIKELVQNWMRITVSYFYNLHILLFLSLSSPGWPTELT